MISTIMRPHHFLKICRSMAAVLETAPQNGSHCHALHHRPAPPSVDLQGSSPLTEMEHSLQTSKLACQAIDKRLSKIRQNAVSAFTPQPWALSGQSDCELFTQTPQRIRCKHNFAPHRGYSLPTRPQVFPCRIFGKQPNRDCFS
jgi:hypothetical protein